MREGNMKNSITKYYDKNKKEIKEGMKLKHIDGDVDTVLKGTNCLGFSANKDKSLIYPLTEFDLREWEIHS
jgi:hypothetical protein